MSNVVVVGLQWGDEGKGKIIDVLAEFAGLVVRPDQCRNNRDRRSVALQTTIAYGNMPDVSGLSPLDASHLRGSGSTPGRSRCTGTGLSCSSRDSRRAGHAGFRPLLRRHAGKREMPGTM